LRHFDQCRRAAIGMGQKMTRPIQVKPADSESRGEKERRNEGERRSWRETNEGGKDGLADQQRLLLNTERKGQKSCLVFLGTGGNTSQQIVFRRAGQASGGDAHAEGSEAGTGTRLSSQPLPLSPSAVTLNNTFSLITTTITLRNKLVFFQRGMEMGKRRPP
ncbi:hypothetical protein JOQ06_005507, partial [Pogonophryne albipinna]